ncbi:MAG: hypothetical protein EXQ85_04070 [Alphaproteobacteria bacterium]|nr:hypothetical protein [Alphaproteobacteria bacterium]
MNKRWFALAVVAVAGVAAVWPAVARHPYNGALDFAVLRGGTNIGFHRLEFRDDGEETHVAVDVELKVKFGFVTLFNYEHHNREVWKNGVLQRMQAATNDNGDRYEVGALRTDAGLTVQSSKGGVKSEAVLPMDAMPATYWNVASMKQSALIDTQRGGLLKVTITPGPVDDVPIGDGKTVKAQRYDMVGELNLTIWYTSDGQWVGMKFQARGSDIEYALGLTKKPGRS